MKIKPAGKIAIFLVIGVIAYFALRPYLPKGANMMMSQPKPQQKEIPPPDQIMKNHPHLHPARPLPGPKHVSFITLPKNR
jgi:hypothetical protein